MNQPNQPANELTSKPANFFLGILGLFGILGIPSQTLAAPITLRLDHHLFTVNPDTHPEWREPEEIWLYKGKEIPPPAELRVDGDVLPSLPPGMIRSERSGWNKSAIEQTLQKVVATPLQREAGSVVIKRSLSGAVVFEGVGMLGREVILPELSRLVVQAIAVGATDVQIPIWETQPAIIVEDPELQKLGIREVVTVGESDFAGSPIARRHNIAVGMARFNGHLVEQGEIFSFNEVLGPVNGATGYWKELVIKGELTIPDYGGGLCQVSSTAYRGVWEYGFPIVDRRNHSFAVTYYAPHGTDATIYPPNVDMKFANDSKGALAIQTHIDGNKAYFIYYGTRDTRQTDVIGPYLWDFRGVPEPREDFTTDIPVGERRKVSDKHPGVKAAWFRFVARENEEPVQERIFSAYDARGIIFQTGVAPADLPPSVEDGYIEQRIF